MVQAVQSRRASKTLPGGMSPIPDRQKFQYLTVKETDEFKKFENVTPAIQND